MVRLVTPAAAYRRTFLQGADEFVREHRLQSTYAPALGYDLQRLQNDFDHFVDDLVALDSGARGELARYADRVLWLVDGDDYIGQVSIRPELATDFLLTYGGHIGYSIRPGRRGCGHGTRILALALPVARQLGLARVLVTCDADNEASRRIIQRNGGRFECALPMPPQVLILEGRDPGRRLDKLRFWIDLSSRTGTAPAVEPPLRCPRKKTCASRR